MRLSSTKRSTNPGPTACHSIPTFARALLALVLAVASLPTFAHHPGRIIGPDRLPMPIVHADESIDIVYVGGTFSPPQVELERGAEVVFSNSSDRPVWPASNIHPTHDIYPEFDPKAPIPPGGEWRFVPDRSGAWRFHNHLAADEGGMIVVLGASPDAVHTEDVDPGTVRFETPRAMTSTGVRGLFDDDGLLAESIQRYGPAATVHWLSQFERQLGRDCHERAHELGRMAYGLYGAGAFALSGHECQSGSYHGAIEAMFRERGTDRLEANVKKVCAYASNQFYRHNCVHGVGHGLMAWTNYELPEALALCDQLETQRDAASCFSGVFMENVIGGLSGQMGHFSNYLSDDPHYPCNALPSRYLKACYGYQTTRMIRLFRGDFAKLSDACDASPKSVHSHCFYSMGRDIETTLGARSVSSILACSHTASKPNQIQCLLGVAQNAFWDASGADDASHVCRTLIDLEKKERCWIAVMRRGKEVLQRPAAIRSFCDRVEPGYHFRRPIGRILQRTLARLNPFSDAPPGRDDGDDAELCYRPLPQWDRAWAWVRKKLS
ncbi:MAG: cupredoxin domain-containing protein [Pseudomonadota bacterium]